MVLNLPGLSELRLSFWAMAFLRMLLMRVDFPEPDTPVTAINFPSGKRAVTFCKLFSRAPVTSIKRPLPVRRSVGTGIARLPDKYWPVIDLLLRATCLGVPAATISPTKNTGTGTNVNQIIRLTHGIFVMFHHNECITQVAHLFETGDQAVIVSLVETD